MPSLPGQVTIILHHIRTRNVYNAKVFFRQIDKVLTTEEFLDIDRDTLCTLLQRENLRINECVLFKGVLK